MEKVIPGETTGEGIKRTPSYETPLSKHKLEKWRQEFWGKFIFTSNQANRNEDVRVTRDLAAVEKRLLGRSGDGLGPNRSSRSDHASKFTDHVH